MSKHNHNQLELVTLKPKSIEDPFLLLMPLRAALLSYFYLSVLLSLYLAERPSKPSDMPTKRRSTSVIPSPIFYGAFLRLSYLASVQLACQCSQAHEGHGQSPI